MSDQGKKEKSIARWLKNAEDHSRMEAQLATIKTHVDGLNQWVGKLEDGLTELRKETSRTDRRCSIRSERRTQQN